MGEENARGGLIIGSLISKPRIVDNLSLKQFPNLAA